MTTAAASPVVLIGYRPSVGRAPLLEHTLDFYRVELGWRVIIGHDGADRPFSLSCAINHAADAAGDWDVAVIAAGDAVPALASQVVAASSVALDTGRLVFCHDHYYALSTEGTDRVLSGWAPNARLAEWDAWSNTFSTISVVPRCLWEKVGGWDERFVGWGQEDFAFWSACWALAGGFERVPGPVFHLWHGRPEGDYLQHPRYQENADLGERYTRARHDKEGMLAILHESGAPLCLT